MFKDSARFHNNEVWSRKLVGTGCLLAFHAQNFLELIMLKGDFFSNPNSGHPLLDQHKAGIMQSAVGSRLRCVKRRYDDVTHAGTQQQLGSEGSEVAFKKLSRCIQQYHFLLCTPTLPQTALKSYALVNPSLLQSKNTRGSKTHSCGLFSLPLPHSPYPSHGLAKYSSFCYKEKAGQRYRCNALHAHKQIIPPDQKDSHGRNEYRNWKQE